MLSRLARVAYMFLVLNTSAVIGTAAALGRRRVW